MGKGKFLRLISKEIFMKKQDQRLISLSTKGQAAMEFLMTYGWAILVVLAAIAALSYFGVLNPSKFLPEKCLMETGFTCISSKVETTKVTLILSNGLGKTIDVNGISVINTQATCGTTFSPAVRIITGEQASLNWSGCSNGVVGESFKGNIEVDYTERNPGGVLINKTAAGDLAVKIQ